MGMLLPTKFTTLIINDYITELDETDEVEQIEINMYQERIGDLRWAIDIGRVYILN